MHFKIDKGGGRKNRNAILYCHYEEIIIWTDKLQFMSEGVNFNLMFSIFP
jgi:hypothetical protein